MTARPRSWADILPVNNRDERMLQAFQQLVVNYTLLRRDLSRSQTDPRRSLEREAGYPQSGEAITPEACQEMFDRDSVANRAVGVYPDESWQDPPEVYEKESGKISTEFERAWDAIGQQLQPVQSWHKQEKGSAIWPHLENADILAGIGNHGAIFLGLDDGRDPREPAAGVVEMNSFPSDVKAPADNAQIQRSSGNPYRLTVNAKQTAGRKLLFMREFSQVQAVGSRFEANISSPRYGLPTEYQITVGNPLGYAAGSGAPQTNLIAHWSRVVHIAEQDGYHTPRLTPIWNNLLGARKVSFADPEAYWKNTFMKLFFEGEGSNVDIDTASLKDALENMMNGSEHFMSLAGMTAKAIPPQVTDPGPHLEVQVRLVCIQLRVPQKIFEGVQTGRLAADEDSQGFYRRVRKRKGFVLTPRLICPVVDRFIMLGVLPQPEQYFVGWPEDEALDEVQKSTVLLNRTKAYVAAQSGGLFDTIPESEFMTRIDSFSDEEAKQIEAAAKARKAEKEADEQAAMERQRAKIDAGLAPDPAIPRMAFPPQPTANGA